MIKVWQWRPSKRPTLLFRCILLISAELAVNALLWIVAAIVFRHRTRFLTLSVLAWTLGLRHALDADHISVIDNATRCIVSVNRVARPSRPVTCGLWFSLGHSTIVVTVISAIAISLGIVDRLGKVNSVGGIVGAAVSGSTLFLFAIVNSILLYQSIMATRRLRKQSSTPAIAPSTQNDKEADVEIETGKQTDQDQQGKDHRFTGIFTRLAYPLFRLVDRPYKLYPIGVLFGLGFDTASSIALLGIAGATNTQVQNTDLDSSQSILPGNTTTRSDASIVLLALLFTAGMTLVDSLDSVLMINAYAPGELLAPPATQDTDKEHGTQAKWRSWIKRFRFLEDCDSEHPRQDALQDSKPDRSDEAKSDGVEERESVDASKSSTSTSLSHLLTLLSILLALAISIITLMGLIGENCARCASAATKQADTHDGGLEGRWWLFWQQANDASGIIGACIVGSFALILTVWYAAKAVLRRCRPTPSQ